jgi:hypothetical protein
MRKNKITFELRINKGTLYLFLMGRGDFSLPARSVSAEAGRPDFGRLKPPLPRTDFILLFEKRIIYRGGNSPNGPPRFPESEALPSHRLP